MHWGLGQIGETTYWAKGIALIVRGEAYKQRHDSGHDTIGMGSPKLVFLSDF